MRDVMQLAQEDKSCARCDGGVIYCALGAAVLMFIEPKDERFVWPLSSDFYLLL